MDLLFRNPKMRKNSPNPQMLDILKRHQEELRQACRQYRANRIRVFGSVARGEENAESDVDILVELPAATI